MRYRKLDANGDYTPGSNAFLINSPEAVGQAVLTSLKLFQGELFINTSAGVPWTRSILGKSNTNYDVLIKEVILNVQGVSSIVSYASTYDAGTRKLSITATIATVYGTTTVSTSL